ncbi:hypothetical protein MRB53_032484 [Persea americana]|uniref:Uncharacterized protein n=1 Tax=Persea americana TaxID=3435 RepID=A0ACC2KSI6_PERAE|nr:hypothetical protein MRB53_032484 [Persea americana]
MDRTPKSKPQDRERVHELGEEVDPIDDLMIFHRLSSSKSSIFVVVALPSSKGFCNLGFWLKLWKQKSQSFLSFFAYGIVYDGWSEEALKLKDLPWL